MIDKPVVLVWFDNGKGSPRVVGFTPPNEPDGTLNVVLLACSKMLDRIGNVYAVKRDEARGAEKLDVWADDVKKSAGGGKVLDFGPERGTVEITADDVGILFMFDDAGYPVVDVGLSVQPTAPQLWAASALCDELARFNIRGEIVMNSEKQAGGGPDGGQRSRKAPRLEIATRATRLPRMDG